MRSNHPGLCMAIVLLCGSCTSTPKAGLKEPASAAAVDETATAALYERIGSATSRFQGGLELIRAGSPRSGREGVAAALSEIETAANTCAQTRGCETERFIAALTVLIRLQSVAAGWETQDEDEAAAPATDAELVATSPIKATNPSSTVKLLRGKDLSQLIVVNEPVRAALEDWLTWMRPQLIETWVNYSYLRGEMWPAYERAGLPEALLFGMLAKESAARVHSYSSAGAAGPLQFMPATAQRFGIGNINGRDGRLDPATAARANVAYLHEQLIAFDNNLELSLAAYNGGESRMRRLAKQHPGKGFWSNQILFALPAETRDYVPKVLAAAYLFMHPEQYGLQFPSTHAELAQLPLQSSMSLGELSICLGQEARAEGWFRTLRNLNPQLPTDERLPVGSRLRVPKPLVEVYAQRCREPKLLARIAKLQDARHPQGPTQVAYAVRRGDTLQAIARRTRCSSADQIGRLNGLKGPQYSLRVGQQIRLPTCS